MTSLEDTVEFKRLAASVEKLQAGADKAIARASLKYPVTERALIQRLNRKLAEDDQKIKKTRGDGQAFRNLGTFYVLNWRRNLIVQHHLDADDLIQWAKKLGVMAGYENLVPDEPQNSKQHS